VHRGVSAPKQNSATCNQPVRNAPIPQEDNVVRPHSQSRGLSALLVVCIRPMTWVRCGHPSGGVSTIKNQGLKAAVRP
jgi:hypothetical protein